jgi:predicted transcriptional regulator
LIIKENNKIIGIVTRTDLLKTIQIWEILSN